MKTLKFVAFGMISLGVLLFMVGLLFEFLELSDLWRGIISGPIFCGMGTMLLLFSLIKERRKR
jgi:hypothetical protein